MDARANAGQRLADSLTRLAGPDLVILGLAGGGVLIGAEIARRLGAPLDVFIVRKVVVTREADDHVVGAIATGGIQVIDDVEIRRHRIPDAAVAAGLAQQLRELRRQESAYRTGRRNPDLRDRVVLLVDDGLQSGATMRVAMAAVRRMGARRVELAVAVGSKDACILMRQEADGVTCLQIEPSARVTEAARARLGPVSEAEVRAALAAGPAPV